MRRETLHTGRTDGKCIRPATMMVAVNNNLTDDSRFWAQARCRVMAGLTFFAAGIPMFFMGRGSRGGQAVHV